MIYRKHSPFYCLSFNFLHVFCYISTELCISWRLHSHHESCEICVGKWGICIIIRFWPWNHISFPTPPEFHPNGINLCLKGFFVCLLNYIVVLQLQQKSILQFFEFLNFISIMCIKETNTHVCAHVCILSVPTEAKRLYQIPWNWSSGWLLITWYGYWELNLCPLQGQQWFLTAKSSQILQFYNDFYFLWQ